MAHASLAGQLLDLHDQVLELTDQCAFISEAYSALAVQNEAFDRHLAAGIVVAGQRLREKAEAVQERVKEIQESVRGQLVR